MTKDDAILEAGRIALECLHSKGTDWDGHAIVVNVAPEHRRFNGYVYDGPNWSAFSPQEKGFEFLDVLQELQDAMAADTGNRWKQALIHITRPGPEIDIQFEYDDPTRWSLKKVSLDLADYAESLRPPGANK